MIKAFGLTLLFWTLFIFTNTVGDAIDFYAVFPWYGRMDIWHFLKYWWIGFAVLTGVFALRLWINIKYDIHAQTKFYPNSEYKVSTVHLKKKKYRFRATLTFVVLLFWFILLRHSLHEGLMWLWRQP